MPSFSVHFHLLLVRVTYPTRYTAQFYATKVQLEKEKDNLEKGYNNNARQTEGERPCQTEPKLNAVYLAPLLGLHHPTHRRHFHSMGAHHHHPLQHHSEQE